MKNVIHSSKLGMKTIDARSEKNPNVSTNVGTLPSSFSNISLSQIYKNAKNSPPKFRIFLSGPEIIELLQSSWSHLESRSYCSW